MGITGKVMTILISLLVLGLWPLFFGKFTDSALHSKYKISQVTTNGWFFLLSALIAIAFNVRMIVLDDRVSNKQQQDLKQELLDIKSAVKRNNSIYDTATKTIINTNTGDAAFIMQGENVSAHGFQINQNTNSTNILLEQDFLNMLQKVAKDYKIKSNDVYILIIRGTNGDVAKAEVIRLLVKNGYKIIGEGEADRPNLKNGLLVETFKTKLCVSIGNMPK